MFQIRHTAATLALIVSTLCFGVQAESSTYYVSKSGNDSNSCASATSTTQSNQKLTIQAGLGCLTGASDTLYIHVGTYNESIFETYFGTSGTSWSSFITVAGYSGEQVILQPGDGGGNIVRFSNSAPIFYVLLQDLILDGSSQPTGNPNVELMYLGPSSNNLHFNRVEIRNSPYEGALIYGSYLEFRDMNVHHNGDLAGQKLGAEGFYSTGNFISFIGGSWHDNECFGIRIWDSAHPTHLATDNVVDGVTFYNNGQGIGLGGASTCGSGGGGTAIDDTRNTVMNSVFYNNFWGVDDSTSYVPATGNCYYNNTFYNNRHGINISYGNTTIQNNISYSNGDNDFNVCTTGSIGACERDSGNNTADHNLVAMNPSFLKPSSNDFHLTSASTTAIDQGVTIAAVARDFDDVMRPQGPRYDIGAYEAITTRLPSQPTGLIVR